MRKELRVQYKDVFGDWIDFADFPHTELNLARKVTTGHQQHHTMKTQWRLLRKRKTIIKAA
jgi:hypothetical protein